MLIGFTVLWLCVYFSLETYASLARGGVLSFGYLIDLVGMLLMAAGVLMARSRRPGAFSLLSAGWAWTSANFWRGTMERFRVASPPGQSLQFGAVELWLGPALTLLAMCALLASLRASLRSHTDVFP